MKKLSTFFFSLALISVIDAQTIWNSGSLTFTKTAPFQQDCITDGVCLTRGANSVIYNEVTENYLDGDGDCNWTPGNTVWAYGNIANWNTLTYNPLYILNGCAPPSMVNQPMVLHIMPDDIYLQLTFSFWGQGSGGGGNYTYTRTTPTILGIKLIAFEVKQSGTICILNWATSSEKNNKGFYIERSNDGRNFETIDFVSAKANSESGNTYTYTDLNPTESLNYYRLKQIDHDDSYNYSWVVNTIVKSSSVKVYPNPGTNIIHLEIQGIKTGSWKLTSPIGRLLKSGNLDETEININDFPSGMYILSINDGPRIIVKNVVKL